jgi:3-oxoacyl-[acyl-carrier-protein] synthase II
MTGAGMITPLGLGRDATWQAVLQGRCGIGPMPAIESPLQPGTQGGQAPDLPADFAPELPREARYLRHAILEALRDAGVADKLPYPAERCGLLLGTTLHGMRAAGRFLRSKNHGDLKDFLAGAVLRNATEGFHFNGASLTTCSACSSSLGSIALAMTMLRTGELDLVVAGGYDAISEYVYGGFNSLRLVASGPVRPFTRGREGMKLSEGYGIVVLERAEDAAARGARPLAAVLGFGESADAHHLTQPHPQGEGAARAMTQALADAGVTIDEIDLIAAHATGTPDNDASEFAALSRVFGQKLPHIPVVAFKSHLGHTLGGAGAVELILSALALRDQVVPACANVQREDVEFDNLNVTTGDPRRARIRFTLNTSLGFGGANTCVTLGLPAETPSPVQSRRPMKRPDRDVFITGIGTVFPGAIGNEQFLALRSNLVLPEHQSGRVTDEEILPLLNARRVRRMSEYVKLSLAATVLCLRDAGVENDREFSESCAAILGTTQGSTGYCEAYYSQIVNEGIAGANPMMFAEGVPNAAAAHLSLMLSLKGPCQTVIGSRTAGLDAIRLAWTRIAAGEWERAVVGAAEEYSTQVDAAYRHWVPSGEISPRCGAGAVTFLLESKSSLESRRGRACGRVLGGAGSACRGRNIARLVRQVVRQLSNPPRVIGSANGTWIDRAEAAGLRGTTILAPDPHLAECYSVLPLAAIAGRLLAPDEDAKGPTRFASIATDYSGSVSGVLIETSSL